MVVDENNFWLTTDERPTEFAHPISAREALTCKGPLSTSMCDHARSAMANHQLLSSPKRSSVEQGQLMTVANNRNLPFASPWRVWNISNSKNVSLCPLPPLLGCNSDQYRRYGRVYIQGLGMAPFIWLRHHVGVRDGTTSTRTITHTQKFLSIFQKPTQSFVDDCVQLRDETKEDHVCYFKLVVVPPVLHAENRCVKSHERLHGALLSRSCHFPWTVNNFISTLCKGRVPGVFPLPFFFSLQECSMETHPMQKQA